MEKKRTIPTVSADHGWSWGWECWSNGESGIIERSQSAAENGIPEDEWEGICDQVNDFMEDLEVEIRDRFPREYQLIDFLYKVSDDIWDAYQQGAQLDELLRRLWDTLTRPLPFTAPAEVEYE